ncbi:MAG: hypothetical protein ACRBBR_08335 [Cellvibrionaceae bacterium]
MKIFQAKKYLLVVFLAGILGSSLVVAHGKKEPNFDRLAEELNLEESQKAEFVSLMQSQHEKRKVIKEASREERKNMMDQHREETLSALSSVLTDEQLSSFETHLEQRRAESKERKMKHKSQNQ